MKARLDALLADNAALKAENARLQTENASAQDTFNKLLACKAQLNASRPAAHKARTVPADNLPLDFSWRPSVIGNGLVLRLKPHSSSLVVNVTWRGKSQEFLVSSGRLTEIGHLEGFAFAPGDDVTLEVDGYKPRYISAPL
jgi:hypothetical protein